MARKIAHYSIVRSTAAKFVDLVQAAIEQGWQPYGTPFSDDGSLCQAMVKDEGVEDRSPTVKEMVGGE